MKRILTAAVLFISVLTAGCAAVKNYPARTLEPAAELDRLRTHFNLADMFTEYDSRQGAARKNYRDDVINVYVLAMDRDFEDFQQDLVREGSLLNVGVDWGLLGLTAASAVAPLAHTKTVLSAVATGITGAKTSVDKNIFYKKTIEALLVKMKADRQNVLTSIRKKMQEDTGKYPLSAALIDLEEYFRAGTIPQALINISVTSGADYKEKKQEAESLVIGEYGADDASRRIRKYWKPDGTSIDTSHQDALKTWMKQHEVADPVTSFINLKQYKDLRQQAVEELNIP